MTKILFCHIGQFKTGTTSIQNLLLKINLNQDIYILKKFLNTEETQCVHDFSHHALAWYFYKDERYNHKKNKFNISDLKEEILDKKKFLFHLNIFR